MNYLQASIDRLQVQLDASAAIDRMGAPAGARHLPPSIAEELGIPGATDAEVQARIVANREEAATAERAAASAKQRHADMEARLLATSGAKTIEDAIAVARAAKDLAVANAKRAEIEARLPPAATSAAPAPAPTGPRYEDMTPDQRARVRAADPNRYEELVAARDARVAEAEVRAEEALLSKRYEDMTTAERHALFVHDPERARAMREEAIERGGL